MKFNERLISLPVGVAVFAVLALAGLMGLLALTAAPSAEAQDATIKFAENGEGAVTTFTATDPEDDAVMWSVGTTIGALDFKIGEDDGVLEFLTPPDFEAPTGGTANDSNTYMVTVTASSPNGQGGTNTDTFEVTVEVTNVEEDGVVTWTVDPDGAGTTLTTGVLDTDNTPILQFQPGAVLMASLTDGDSTETDNAVTNVSWQWYRSPSKTAMGTAISDANTNTYTVKDEANDNDVGMYLRVQASYSVVPGSAESASLVSDYPVQEYRGDNSAPEFASTTVTREVYEGDAGMEVGAPVTATDADGGALNYTLSGTIPQVGGADAFEIDQKTGQIMTAAALNYDAVNGTVPDRSFTVFVRATDSAGTATETPGTSDAIPDDATVTIALKNVDEKPTFSTTGTAIGMTTISVAEGNTALDTTTPANVTYSATDPEGDSVSLTLMGDDGSLFMLGTGGLLSFRAEPDYENPTDMDRNNRYQVTVRASDGTMHTDRMVTVTVTDADEGPEITGVTSPIKYAENGMEAVATFMAADPEGDTVTWPALTGADAADFSIDDGVLTFNSPPDYEAETTGDGGGDVDNDNNYEVTVTASSTRAGGTEMTATFALVVEVTNVAEDGVVTWTVDPDGTGGPLVVTDVNGGMPIVQFQPGALLTATVRDGDRAGDANAKVVPVAEVNWQWYRSSSQASQGTRIDGETSNTYTVQDEANNNDVRSYIRVVARYNVVAGTGETASRVSDYPVQVRLGQNNSAPEFDPDEVDREVYEGEKGMNVGAPVTATDADRDALNYALSGTGADNAKFEIDQKTGQIKTRWDLDREGAAEATADTAGVCAGTPNTECTVTVTATDSAGATAEATVTIALKNVDEKPNFTDGDQAVSVAEGSVHVRADSDTDGDNDADDTANPYVATDEDGTLVNRSLVGDDGSLFRLSADGNLSFKTAPDFENPTDRNKDNKYQVSVRASDGTMYADRMVTVTVTDVNESPDVREGGVAVSGPTSADYVENDTDAVATFRASGPMKDMAMWSVEGDDAMYFERGSDNGRND